MNNSEKLLKLREALAEQGFDGFLVPHADEYQGEYVPACAERLAWLTGFTGSAGLAIVLVDKAVVMSDGRYTIQLEQQVDKSLYSLRDSQELKPEEWLCQNVVEGMLIGYDPKLHTSEQIRLKEEAGILLQPVIENPIDKIWEDRPTPPKGKVKLFSEKFAGVSAGDKIKQIQTMMKAEGADAVVLTLPDSIAWLFNIRGEDVAHIPVALSYAIVPVEGRALWFVDKQKLTEMLCNTLSDIIDIKGEDALCLSLKELGSRGATVWLDPKRSSFWFKKELKGAGAQILAKDDPCIWPRACKNKFEQAAMKAAHLRDGVALTKFLKYFNEESVKGDLTELSVEAHLESLRAQAPEFKEPSFDTIAGYGANGAIVHYRADEGSNLKIEKGNLLLFDSGGQYEDGTTDVTRTMAVGMPAEEMKERFTLVLKGHIALASVRFPKGTLGRDLDKLARAPLQAHGLDYSHGTGHGVGCYLSVHEASAGISPRGEEAVQAGMIISNEPGYYKEGAYGIRIESLLLAHEGKEGELYFETITLAPIDKNLIVFDMLDDKEKKWLNTYHAHVYETLAPLLDRDTAIWLKAATLNI